MADVSPDVSAVNEGMAPTREFDDHDQPQSHPPTHSRQQLTVESTEDKRRRRRRRPSQTSSTASEQPTTSTRRLPPIRGTQPSDMVVADSEDPAETLARPPALVKDASALSVPVASVFVQQPKRFRKTDRETYEQVLAERSAVTGDDDGIGGAPVVGTMGAGAALQRGFHSVALMLQGLLAGVSLCQCLFILLFSGQDELAFLLSYAPTALPTQQALYVAYVICAVAAFDRYDVGQSFGRVLLRALTFQSGAVAVLLYLGAVALLLLSAPFDERLDRSRKDRTQLFTTTPDGSRLSQPWLFDEVTVWKWSAVARAVLTVSAWLIVAGKPDTHQLHKHMRETDQNFADSLNRTAAVVPAVEKPPAPQQLT